MKQFRIFITILLMLSAAIAGYFYFDNFGTGQPPLTITELVEPSSQPDKKTPAEKKDGRPDIQQNSGSLTKTKATEKTTNDDSEKTQSTKDNPSFDIVRVEPSGDTLIAGQAVPNSKVLIEKNGKVIAETTTDDHGAFVALPSDAIKGENNQVVIRSVQNDGTENVSDQIVAIAVPEDGEPLVALVEPGRAVEILQKPKITENSKELASKEDKLQDPSKGEAPNTPLSEITIKPDTSDVPNKPQIAQTSPVKEDKSKEPEIIEPKQTKNTVVTALEEKTEPDQKIAATQPSEDTRRVARLLKPDDVDALSGTEAGSVKQTIPVSPDTTSQAQSSSDDQALEPPSPDNSLTERSDSGEQNTAALEITTEQNVSSLENTEPVETISEPKEKTKPLVKTSPPSKAPKVSVEAVEVDGDKIFIAGEAKTGGTIRVYVDGENIGDVKVPDNGRWLFEDKKRLNPGQYTIRIDQITTATGGVGARAEVPFVVEDRTVSDLANAESNTIIIRRNDNLWTIAQRLYGDGLRFTAIYEQNRDQIRDPNLIFPGQTFTLPAGERTTQQ